MPFRAASDIWKGILNESTILFQEIARSLPDPFTLKSTDHPMGESEATGSTQARPRFFSASQSSDWAVLVRAEQIRAIYKPLPGMWVMTVLGGLFIAAAMSKEVPAGILAVWLVGTYAAQSYALFLYFRYTRAAPPPEQADKWGTRIIVAKFLNGSAWGSAGVMMFQPDFTPYQAFLAFVIFLVSILQIAGGNTAFKPGVYALVPPVILPLIIRSAIEGDLLHLMIASGGVVVFAFVLYYAAQMSDLLANSLNLRFENELARTRADEANRAKSRFLAAASHDLRQPLHAMALFVSALKDKNLEPETRRILDHLTASVEALEGLFDALLDISKLDAGIVRPEVRDFPVQAVFDQIGRECAADAAGKGLRLRLMRTRAVVRSDATLFERILRNLVSNAIRYTNAGGVVVGCRRRGDAVRIAVCDTGVGIEPAHLADIFQEFYQVGNPERDRTKGLGLGLAIVDRLARLLTHSIAVVSIPGRGSVFSVTVPRGEVASSEVDLSQPVKVIEGNLGGALVVVIDDEAAVRDGMREVLQHWGCRPLLADSGDEALALLARAASRPAAVIADYRLRAGEAGIAAIERIQFAYGTDIPGVIITGDTAPDRLREAEASGYYLLHKPVRPVKLRALLSFLLSA